MTFKRITTLSTTLLLGVCLAGGGLLANSGHVLADTTDDSQIAKDTTTNQFAYNIKSIINVKVTKKNTATNMSVSQKLSNGTYVKAYYNGAVYDTSGKPISPELYTFNVIDSQDNIIYSAYLDKPAYFYTTAGSDSTDSVKVNIYIDNQRPMIDGSATGAISENGTVVGKPTDISGGSTGNTGDNTGDTSSAKPSTTKPSTTAPSTSGSTSTASSNSTSTGSATGTTGATTDKATAETVSADSKSTPKADSAKDKVLTTGSIKNGFKETGVLVSVLALVGFAGLYRKFHL